MACFFITLMIFIFFYFTRKEFFQKKGIEKVLVHFRNLPSGYPFHSFHTKTTWIYDKLFISVTSIAHLWILQHNWRWVSHSVLLILRISSHLSSRICEKRKSIESLEKDLITILFLLRDLDFNRVENIYLSFIHGFVNERL